MSNPENTGENMSIEEIICQVTAICQKYGVKHLALFGSYAAGNARTDSDIDFVIRGGTDFEKMQEEIERIPTLKKIDLFAYDRIKNQALREDMDLYGKEIY